MKAETIRSISLGSDVDLMPVIVVQMLREIAAQLAEIKELLKETQNAPQRSR